jgi:hypothetical protein
MRLHHRLPALALAAGIALSLVSCEVLGGSKGSPEDFGRLRQGLNDDRANLNRAAVENTLDRVAGILDTMRGRFDEIWSKSSAMNLLDRQHLGIQLASGRKMLTSIGQWTNSADIDAVRSEVETLNVTLNEIDILLDRTHRALAGESKDGL